MIDYVVRLVGCGMLCFGLNALCDRDHHNVSLGSVLTSLGIYLMTLVEGL